MSKTIIPFSLETKVEAKLTAERRLGISRPRLNRLIEDGDLVLMATTPGVRNRIVSASVDAYLSRINATATVSV